MAAQATPEEIALRVTDTGIGIPPEELTRIFDRFYRVDKVRSRAQGGMGLALVRAIAEAQGGRVEAQSRVGAGSTFLIHLPLQSQSGTRVRVEPTL